MILTGLLLVGFFILCYSTSWDYYGGERVALRIFTAAIITFLVKLITFMLAAILATNGVGSVETITSYDCVPLYDNYYVIESSHAYGSCVILENGKPTEKTDDIKVADGIDKVKYVDDCIFITNPILREVAWPLGKADYGEGYIVAPTEAIVKE